MKANKPVSFAINQTFILQNKSFRTKPINQVSTRSNKQVSEAKFTQHSTFKREENIFRTIVIIKLKERGKEFQRKSVSELLSSLTKKQPTTSFRSSSLTKTTNNQSFKSQITNKSEASAPSHRHLPSASSRQGTPPAQPSLFHHRKPQGTFLDLNKAMQHNGLAKL